MKEKPKYSILQNTHYLLRMCMHVTRGLLIVKLALVALQLVTNLAGLYLAPVILQKVEQNVPMEELLATIGIFTLILALCDALYHWIDQVRKVYEMRIFSHLCTEQVRKTLTTAYANLFDTNFVQTREQAEDNMSGNSVNTPPCAMITALQTFLTSVLGFAVYLVMLTQMNGVLIAVTIVTAVASFFVSEYIERRVHSANEKNQKNVNEIMYPVNTVMMNESAKDIRIFHMQPWLLSVFNRAFLRYRAVKGQNEWIRFAGKGADVLLTLARNGIAYVYLLRAVIAGEMSASQFLLYTSAVTGFTAWITSILGGVIDLHRESLRLCKIREALEWEEPFRFEDGKPVPRRADGKYELRLENVSFRYPKAQEDTIHNMNLTIHAGENLAIVGLNGAGKTTLVKLLCGMLDPTEGRVLLDGEDIRNFDRRDYYSMFTAVFQEFSRLQASIAANIAQSETEIDMARLENCVRRAGFADTVAKLPHGLETHLGKLIYEDGIELSGGQEQRLMLARALYKDAPILMLDEPTAALDPIAENDMYLRYNEITQGRTSVYISHRLASTRFCDRVLFLEHGRIAEEGTHEALLALGGGYAELFEVQSKYYREGAQSNEEE